ncbi:PTS N-acetyl-D-glucosamine transporter, partial [Pseudomonas fluorescens ABAC62]
MSNNNNELILSAPLSGPVLNLGNVPDDVFASRAMGDGLAIDPLNDCLHAPCDGEIIHVARTAHALTIRADNGAELLMHVGIDTVELQGEGFVLLVEQGARVSRGQALVRFDLDRVARGCKSLISLLILTNGEHFELRPMAANSVKVGEPLAQIAARAAASLPASVDNSPGLASARVRITHRGGLHARPAALVRKAAQGFSSQAQLHVGDKSASCDSLIGLMSLGVGEGDEVRVSCRGQDAVAALQALVAALSAPIKEEHHVPAAVAPRRANTELGVLQGVCAAPGLVCGPLFRLSGIELPADTRNHCAAEQQQRLDAALEQVRGEIRSTLDHARQRKSVEEEDIFAAHLALLEDPALLQAATAAIEQGCAATHAWRDAIQAQCAVLLALGKPLFAERSNDLRDLEQRVLRALLGESWQVELPAGAIVSAHELTPSDLLHLSAQQAAGICMAEGGATSHVAILARGKGLPCVVALGNEVLDVPQGQRVVLDAGNGRLELTPSEARHAEVHQIREAQKLRHQQQQAQAQRPTHTTDGVSIEVAANVASSAEAQLAFEHGADGVGLLRTEFLFVDRRTAPDEQEQRSAYQAVLDAMGDKSVIIRTIDVGGDKQLDYLPLPVEANPVLGLRGIRMAQVRPELLEQQL